MNQYALSQDSNNLATVFMFSGQGSHYYHMASDLFEQHRFFRKTLFELDEIAHSVNGKSVLREIYSREKTAKDWFDATVYTHPAIVMVEYALAKTLMQEGVIPDYVLSTSMGSFAALAVSGAFSIEQALTASIKQAEALEHSGLGVMMAIVEDIQLFHDTPELHENSFLGGVNFDNHFVVTSTSQNVDALEAFLHKKYKYQLLNITTPFHSPLIDPSEPLFKSYLQDTNWAMSKRQADIPMICCIDGDVKTEFDMAYTWDAVRQPIMFQKAIQNFNPQGHFRYVDVGPSGTLAAFIKYNVSRDSAPQILPILGPRGSNEKRLQAAIDGYFQRG
ncbi:acyltransferase domain-containing protein [Alteromonas sp. a30]|uniref:acyltransferase domain-containing protein n=1 Tax=Alteromonas sp. a30 TaxID=2730917 RepID=UPI0022809918|nr:acyltransferase domain-containing protein [Alteromonas sp. a30]MCY7296485.1 acyltransferase domain-containing protein [Alteromonas sp. a30]